MQTKLKTVAINGVKAKILKESKEAILSHKGKGGMTLPDVGDRVSAPWLKHAKALAVGNDADEIVIYHYRYITYDLRTAMKSISGEFSVIKRYRRSDDGSWTVEREIKRDLS